MTSGDNKTERRERTWMKLMELGEKTGCHQRPDRSFFHRGYQYPVCARCTGVLLGYLLALPMFVLLGFSWLVSGLGILLMLADWLLQAAKMKESTNGRRLVTGILGGYGVMSLQMALIRIVLRFLADKLSL